MTILTVGVDLAKNVLAAHVANEAGKAELIRPPVRRDLRGHPAAANALRADQES